MKNFYYIVMADSQIKRDTYLQTLIRNMNNPFIKVVTGLRRSGKSYLLNVIFKDYLLSIGIKPSHIIQINLESIKNTSLLDPLKLYEYIMSLVTDEDTYYIILDEIQAVPDFEKVLIGFLEERHLDVYVTGSNSKFLSTDIITEFRGRSKEIYLLPLSYKEFSDFKGENNDEILYEYMRYGGLPEVVLEGDEKEKENLLSSFYQITYFKDIIDRYKIKREDVLDDTIHVLASSVGSLTNPLKICKTYKSKGDNKLSVNTISSYLSYLENCFIVSKVRRFNIGDRKEVGGLNKYYFSDLGIRNSLLSYQDNDINHWMENLVYNEMKRRGYKIHVGLINQSDSKAIEIDFICEKGNNKYYIQVSESISDEKTREREFRPLFQTKDYYRKILVLGSLTPAHHDENGILVLNIKDFLINESIIDL